MKNCQFIVGGHALEIRFANTHNDETLLPSFNPFRADNQEPKLVVTVDDKHVFDEVGDEVGQFDCGGCNHGVYLMKDGGYRFEVSDVRGQLCSVMQSNADFSQCVVSLYGETWNQRNFGLNNAMMMAYSFAFATQGTLLVHASVIRKDGYGYLMTAPSGTGKSTHTHLWYKNIPGCDLMNDDNPIVRVTGDDAIIYGSPWSGKTPCYKNTQAPIGAFVRIQQRPENTIRQMRAVEAFATLLPAVSSMKWDARVYHGICDTVSLLLGKVRVFELGCLPNEEAALLCYETVRKC